jgi:hypothetical protein
MINKMTIVAVVGIMTLSLLAIKPLTNQVFAQTNLTSTQLSTERQQQGKCSSDLSLDPHIKVQTVPKGQTTPVDISGTLTCGGVGIEGATVTYRVADNCGVGGGGRPTTIADGSFSDTIDLGPCPTPYSVSADFAGDSTHTPSSASAGFYIEEATGTATQSSNSTK